MANTQGGKAVTAGFDAIQWGYRDATTGICLGSTELTVADTGTSSTMARLIGAQSANVQLPTRNIVVAEGDNSALAAFSFDSTSPVQFDITMGAYDATAINAFQSTTKVTEGDLEYTALTAVGTVLGQFCLILSSSAVSKASGFVGNKGKFHIIVPNAEIAYLGTNPQTGQAAAHTYQVTVNLVDKLPDGRTVSSVFTDAPNGEIHMLAVNADNYITYSTLVGDGVTTAITTTQKPISVAKVRGTVETTGFAADTCTAVDTTDPYGVTLTATAASGKFQNALYEFVNFE